MQYPSSTLTKWSQINDKQFLVIGWWDTYDSLTWVWVEGRMDTDNLEWDWCCYYSLQYNQEWYEVTGWWDLDKITNSWDWTIGWWDTDNHNDTETNWRWYECKY